MNTEQQIQMEELIDEKNKPYYDELGRVIEDNLFDLNDRGGYPEHLLKIMKDNSIYAHCSNVRISCNLYSTNPVHEWACNKCFVGVTNSNTLNPITHLVFKQYIITIKNFHFYQTTSNGIELNRVDWSKAYDSNCEVSNHNMSIDMLLILKGCFKAGALSQIDFQTIAYGSNKYAEYFESRESRLNTISKRLELTKSQFEQYKLAQQKEFSNLEADKMAFEQYKLAQQKEFSNLEADKMTFEQYKLAQQNKFVELLNKLEDDRKEFEQYKLTQQSKFVELLDELEDDRKEFEQYKLTQQQQIELKLINMEDDRQEFEQCILTQQRQIEADKMAFEQYRLAKQKQIEDDRTEFEQYISAKQTRIDLDMAKQKVTREKQDLNESENRLMYFIQQCTSIMLWFILLILIAYQLK